MFIATILLIIVVAFVAGLLLGLPFRRDEYNGVIVVTETPTGLTYRMELAGDPENLATQTEVRFKVIPVDYDELVSR